MRANSLNKPGYFGKGSVEVAPPEREGEGGIRRAAIAADHLIDRPYEGISVIPDVIEYAARTHGTKEAVGWRDIKNIVEEEKEVKKVIDGKEVTEKKKWKYFELGDYQYINYIEFRDAISEVARGLVDLGVERDRVFNIYSQTSLSWQIMAHACGRISTTIATAYDTLGEEGLQHSLNEPECIGLFTNADLLPTLYNVLKHTPTIRFIVYDGKPRPSLVDDIHGVREDLKCFHIDEVRELGKSKPLDTITDRLPKPETMACIMYTSGSTGPPKGVCITHANLVASVGAVQHLLGHQLTVNDHYLAYLPLAHVLEYIVEVIMLFQGVTQGYGNIKTLTDASVRNCKGDIATFRPTIMCGVPAVWETIRKGILARVNAGGSVRKSVFNGAIAAKKNKVPVISQIADSVVLSGVRAATGGRLRIALSGGAALGKETQEFLNIALVTLVQGYGMTESCGMCAILPPDLLRYDTVGLPVPSVEIKLIDVPEAGYLSTNNPPQGEVCLRGGSVTGGYFKRPDLNEDKSIFPGNGWFRTGDVGQWNPDGTLSLIDRIKNLVKLSGGEYIALERLESVYKGCNLVSNICVCGSSDAAKPVAIVIPHEAHLRHALESGNGGDGKRSLAELCHDENVANLVLKSMNAIGKKNGFKPMELLHSVILTAEEWTPESGLVTAAQKINRGKIGKHYGDELKAAYKKQN